MKLNQWTLGLAAAGVISLASVAGAEEAASAPSQVLTALSSTTLSGYVDTSVIWRPGTGNATGAGAFTLGPKQDGFNLNVVKLTLEKPLDEGQWSAGYKVDLLFGPDANAFGTTSTLGAGGATTQDFAIKQAYVALRAPVGNGLDFKFGVFDTIIGYEVFESPNNPNYSRSYGWGLEPTTHTGLLASYRIADFVSVAAGIANTRGPVINGRSSYLNGQTAESRKTYMGSVTLTAPESFGSLKGAAFYAGIIDGSGQGSDMVNYYAGVTVPTPVTGLSVGASYDYLGRSEKSVDGVQLAAANYANATALYLSYQATEKLKLNTRAEYASGTNPGSLNTGAPQGFFNPNATPSHLEVFAATLTADYSLWANVLSRLELRWDHDLSQRSDGTLFDGRGTLFGETIPLSGRKNLFTVALNLVYKF